ncbi:Uma2 family endonuclease [Tautonia sociabilis]|uniref:Uma2 family endonuclease n=2 Tax=Tautonia sociabilis TaxID=2080755 RepID=A0A432MLG7_9BACT|nr:Uma2 family endonuclease [Tautonia sociabilis]
MNPSPLTLRFAPEVELTDDLLWKICAANPELRIERTAGGNLEIMYPAGGESSRRNGLLTARVVLWNDGLGADEGVVFDSSAGFTLPNGAERSPDTSWISRDRWLALTPEQRLVFAPICPDFVAELRSPSDSKRKLREKMREYLANGARLGWLIDPIDGTVEIYRPGRGPETLERPERIDGEDVLPGFVLELRGILFD